MKLINILIIPLFLLITVQVRAWGPMTDIQLDKDSISIQTNNTNWVNTDCLQGNGILKKEKKVLEPFSRIHINGVFNVTIVQQAAPSFEMSADANLLSKIQTHVIRDQLQIASTDSICPKLPIKINIGLPALKEVQGMGADDISILNLNNEHFTIKMDGSSDVRITGHTRVFTIIMSGAGDLDADGFKSDKVSIQSSGAGNGSIFATKELQADISGAGDITFQGNPEKVVVTGDGVGELMQAD